MATVEKLTIFLASPGDVLTERNYVEDIVKELNSTVASDKHIVLQVVKWETSAYPGYGKDAQALINDQIAEMSQYSLFIGIMWNRLGTPTPRSKSGTVEEFQLAVEAFKKKGQPEIWFYFRDYASNLTTDEQLDQRKLVISFKKKVESNGMPFIYNKPAKFKEMYRNQMILWLNKGGSKNNIINQPKLSKKIIQSSKGFLLAVQSAERNSIEQKDYDLAYHNWEIDKDIISNELQNNLNGNKFVAEWEGLSDILTQVYALSGTFDKKYRAQLVNKIESYLKDIKVDSASLLNYELKKSTNKNFHKYYNAWWSIREALILKINEIANKIGE